MSVGKTGTRSVTMYLEWVVDPERRLVVQQYVLTDGVFRSAGEHAARITVACTGRLDGAPLEIELNEVW